MFYKTMIFIAVTLILFSCGSTVGSSEGENGVRIFHDPYKSFTRHSNPFVGALSGQDFLSLDYVYLEVYADEKNGSVSTGLSIILKGEKWFFVEPGESLIINVDGEYMNFFSPNGSRLNRKVGGLHNITEEIYYPITTDQIKQMAKAETIKVRIYSQAGFIDREFSNQHINSINIFYNDVIIKYGINSL